MAISIVNGAVAVMEIGFVVVVCTQSNNMYPQKKHTHKTTRYTGENMGRLLHIADIAKAKDLRRHIRL